MPGALHIIYSSKILTAFLYRKKNKGNDGARAYAAYTCTRGIIPLVRSGLKAQRIPFVGLLIVYFTLQTDAVKICRIA